MKVLKTLLAAVAVSGMMATNALSSEALVKEGEKIFNTKSLGNCVACHAINGKSLDAPGSMGPVLTGLAYYPDEYLYEIIYNSNEKNPISQMPAFGKNGWLSESQIKAVVAYLKTIQ
ncbi:MAG: sulfur oxidation c-type cytochrome SoxX [Sulfurovum sp.]|jgi:sulfur-oxidizing protein SoxX|nr:MAG: Cytochrome c6 [Arcobacter lacus]